jgi:hypothetical protein
MEVNKNGIITLWKWSDEFKKPIKINNEKQYDYNKKEKP